jgi:predicted transcriptional regulator
LKRNSAGQIYSVIAALNRESLQITHLIYRTNVNCLILHNILKGLELKGYVEVSGLQVLHSHSQKIGERRRPRPKYRLTLEGREFYRKIEQAFSALNNILDLCEKQKYLSEAQRLKTIQG